MEKFNRKIFKIKRRLLSNIRDVLFYQAKESYIRTDGSFTCLEILNEDSISYLYFADIHAYLSPILYNSRYAKFW